jgi:hypothetical protein
MMYSNGHFAFCSIPWPLSPVIQQCYFSYATRACLETSYPIFRISTHIIQSALDKPPLVGGGRGSSCNTQGEVTLDDVSTFPDWLLCTLSVCICGNCKAALRLFRLWYCVQLYGLQDNLWKTGLCELVSY